MNAYSDRSRWWFFVFAAVAVLAVGFVAYNAGVSHGAATALAAGAAQAPGAAQPPGAPYPYPYPYGWHRPWGFGFGFPLFFILLFLLFFRGCWGWGGPLRRGWYYEDRFHVKEAPPADDSRRG